ICLQEVSTEWEKIINDLCNVRTDYNGFISGCQKDDNTAKLKTAILYPFKRYNCILNVDKCLMGSLRAAAEEQGLDMGEKDKRTPIGLATVERGNHLLACAFMDFFTEEKFVVSTY